MKSLRNILLASTITSQAFAGPIVDHLNKFIPNYTGTFDGYVIDKRITVFLYKPEVFVYSSDRLPTTTIIKAKEFIMVDANSNEQFDGLDFVKIKESDVEKTYEPTDKRGQEIFYGIYNKIRGDLGLVQDELNSANKTQNYEKSKKQQRSNKKIISYLMF